MQNHHYEIDKIGVWKVGILELVRNLAKGQSTLKVLAQGICNRDEAMEAATVIFSLPIFPQRVAPPLRPLETLKPRCPRMAHG